MKNINKLKIIKTIYDQGGNIMEFLNDGNKNNINDILISYDLQAGSYIKNFTKNFDFYNKYGSEIANEINKLGNFESILEIGIGEATTYSVIYNHLKSKPQKKLGFDISLSRLLYAKEFLNQQKLKDTSLFTADLFNIPLPDNSIDIVYTSHSIEPNGGKELEALKELYRITKKYLVLLEPAYEFASEKARKRMEKFSYVKNLYSTAKKSGYKVIKHELFKYSINKLNPTGILIIEKKCTKTNVPVLLCPLTKTQLKNYNDEVLFSRESLLAYPIIKKIPCLLKENAIIATQLDKFY